MKNRLPILSILPIFLLIGLVHGQSSYSETEPNTTSKPSQPTPMGDMGGMDPMMMMMMGCGMPGGMPGMPWIGGGPMGGSGPTPPMAGNTYGQSGGGLGFSSGYPLVAQCVVTLYGDFHQDFLTAVTNSYLDVTARRLFPDQGGVNYMDSFGIQFERIRSRQGEEPANAGSYSVRLSEKMDELYPILQPRAGELLRNLIEVIGGELQQAQEQQKQLLQEQLKFYQQRLQSTREAWRTRKEAALAEREKLGSYDPGEIEGLLASLKKNRENLETKLSGIDARKDALARQISDIDANSRSKMKDDPIAKELQEIVSIRERELSNLVSNPPPPGTDPAKKRVELAEAKIKLAERLEQVRSALGGDDIKKWNSEMSGLALNAAEFRAQLEANINRIAEIQGKKLVAAAIRCRSLEKESDQFDVQGRMLEQTILKLQNQLDLLMQPARIVILGQTPPPPAEKVKAR